MKIIIRCSPTQRSVGRDHLPKTLHQIEGRPTSKEPNYRVQTGRIASAIINCSMRYVEYVACMYRQIILSY